MPVAQTSRSGSKRCKKDCNPLAPQGWDTVGGGTGTHNQVTHKTGGFYNKEEVIFSSSPGDKANNVNNVGGDNIFLDSTSYFLYVG